MRVIRLIKRVGQIRVTPMENLFNHLTVKVDHKLLNKTKDPPLLLKKVDIRLQINRLMVHLLEPHRKVLNMVDLKEVVQRELIQPLRNLDRDLHQEVLEGSLECKSNSR